MMLIKQKLHFRICLYCTSVTIVLCGLLSGCSPVSKTKNHSNTHTLLDTQYANELKLPADRLDNQSSTPHEGGWYRWSYNQATDELELRFYFVDSDLLAKGESDQLPHYKLGDVLEIFLQSPQRKHYWEIFVTPRSYRSSLLWTKQHHRGDEDQPSLRIWPRVDVKLHGTLNDSSDIDEGWSGTVYFSVKDFGVMGDTLPLDRSWYVLIARQNYKKIIDKDHRELSSSPGLTQTNFHLHAEYANLDELLQDAY
ncbi:hypothetical protein KS4_13110 [Poriferisphaera corsica]|uniref:Uncharacterized protein n=1 Tax=Poriferisphaera corsica TaxID=2528020 RepID=A0A517YSR0_9BACT|nr:hypothetical protein [Poriferisphaera corsica]QDU33266.1 hypothetical protein KS4_13110 [Poriferisphaera corsica]